MKQLINILLIVLFSVSIGLSAESVLVSKKVDSPLKVDGIVESVWDGIDGIEVEVSKMPEAITLKNRELQDGKWLTLWNKDSQQENTVVTLKSAHTETEIFFLAEWPDKTNDNEHKTYHWDKEKEEYVSGKEREDRFVFTFSISGDFEACMISSNEQTNDVWHWKAFRTNHVGIAHDKSHIITLTKPAMIAGKHFLPDGKPVYILRPSDGGSSPYKMISHFNGKEFDELEYMGADDIPAYEVFIPDNQDAADVKAKGVWNDAKWTLEAGRRLKTGFEETDVQFELNSEVPMAIATFDHSGDNLHLLSEKIILKVE